MSPHVSTDRFWEILLVKDAVIVESFMSLIIDFSKTQRLVHSLKICKSADLLGLVRQNVRKISLTVRSRCQSQHDVIVFKVIVHQFTHEFAESMSGS